MLAPYHAMVATKYCCSQAIGQRTVGQCVRFSVIRDLVLKSLVFQQLMNMTPFSFVSFSIWVWLLFIYAQVKAHQINSMIMYANVCPHWLIQKVNKRTNIYPRFVNPKQYRVIRVKHCSRILAYSFVDVNTHVVQEEHQWRYHIGISHSKVAKLWELIALLWAWWA